MSRKKPSLLIQLITAYTQLSEADRVHFSDFIRSQKVKGTAKKSASDVIVDKGDQHPASAHGRDRCQLQSRAG